MAGIRFDPRSPDLTGAGSFPAQTFKPGGLGMRTPPTLAVSVGRVGAFGGGRLTQIAAPALRVVSPLSVNPNIAIFQQRAAMAPTLTTTAVVPAGTGTGNGGQAAVGGGLLAGVVILLALMSGR